MMPPKPLVSAPRATTTESLWDLLHHARNELVEQTRLARGGLHAVRRHSERFDDLVRRIYTSARCQTTTPLALVAVGGYGRKQMSLYSDVDILIVFDGSIGAAEERFLKSMLHPLWDLRLDVGHHIRELADASTVDTDNPKYLVALLDARFLAGDAGVFDRFSIACLQPDTGWRAPTLEALQELIRRRHAQFNDTLYHLEPDVKDAPGGLRDVSAARMLCRLTRPDRPPAFETGRLAEAEDFVVRVRSILHLERERNLNVLTHELQEIVASAFGLVDEAPRRRVETLMSTYFHHTRIVRRSLDATVKLVAPSPETPVVAIGDDLVRWGKEISFADGIRASLRPATWLRAFEVALDEDGTVSQQVLRCVERHGERYSPERFFPTEGERDRLLRMLRPRPGLYAALSNMHDSGLLGRLFPEFQKIYCHVILDFYHKFTVDEHTLLTIRNLESLCAPAPKRKRFGGLLAEVRAPELLVLALLFHDVGKWTNKNHSEESARMALQALRRIRLPEHDIATVQFLIRHHLQMSRAAFRRDVEDPDVVQQFARIVGTEERLKLLCLLTLVDVEAVGPDMMTPWKEELLWHLYVDTYNKLTLGYGDEVIDSAETTSHKELQDGRPADIESQDLEAFLRGLPHRYLRLVEKARIYEHIRLSRNVDGSKIQCSLEAKDSIWELTVLSVDQPKLYAKICGILSYFGMDILRGQAMSNEQGVALDIFQFTDTESFFRLNLTGQDEFIHRLQEVVAGREDIDQTLLPKERGLVRRQPGRFRAIVHLDNQYSNRFSILEIVAQNAWGLLYRISRVISYHDCDIELVLASTEGSRAIDVFHMTKNGAKLSADDTMTLQQALERLLDEAKETP